MIVIVFLSGILLEKFEVIVVVGFDGVEIFENDLFYYDGSLCDVCWLCVDLGLEILLF